MVFSWFFPTPKCKKTQGKAMIFPRQTVRLRALAAATVGGPGTRDGDFLSLLVIVDTCFFKTNTDYTDNKYLSSIYTYI